MAFVNEYVSEEDKVKYGLDELWASYHDVLNQKLPNKKDWTIDREREIWLMETAGIRDPDLDHAYLPEQIWILHYQGHNIEVRIEVSSDEEFDGNKYHKIWDLLALSPDSLENISTEGLIELLEEALVAFGYEGVWMQYPNYNVALRDCRRDK